MHVLSINAVLKSDEKEDEVRPPFPYVKALVSLTVGVEG
jgi:hypothetical protein